MHDVQADWTAPLWALVLGFAAAQQRSWHQPFRCWELHASAESNLHRRFHISWSQTSCVQARRVRPSPRHPRQRCWTASTASAPCPGNPLPLAPLEVALW